MFAIAGNVQDWEMEACLENALIPTVCSVDSLKGMADALAVMKAEVDNTDAINNK
jgi:hypothetical protein